MIKCQFNPDGPPWTCIQCGWIDVQYDKPVMSVVPPRRRCPNAPEKNTPEYREAIRQQTRQRMLTELQTAIDERHTRHTMKQFVAKFNVCLDDCDRIENGVCIARGSECGQWKRWLEHILFHAEDECSYRSRQT